MSNKLGTIIAGAVGEIEGALGGNGAGNGAAGAAGAAVHGAAAGVAGAAGGVAGAAGGAAGAAAGAAGAGPGAAQAAGALPGAAGAAGRGETGGAATGDSSLPDPTSYARWVLLGLVVASVILAVALNLAGATAKAFSPAANKTANFALFSGFYVAAQVIERLLELVSPLVPNPLLPRYELPAALKDPAAKAAQIKADRAKVILGVAAVLGVAISCGFGLFFLQAVGIHASHTVDTFFTGITIAAGTKPLHDFISMLQNQSTPTTPTGTHGV